jgi:hypothetical protein
MKTFLKEAAVLSVYDIYENEKNFIGKTLIVWSCYNR